MAYAYDDGAGQRLILDNLGTQTQITLASRSVGQQQQASQSFQTGSWTAAPELFQAATGLVVKLKTAAGEQFIQVQGNSLSPVSAAAVGSAPALHLQQIGSASPMEPMQPMQPMQPMKPMQPMQMSQPGSPMEMRMGNMRMQMQSGGTHTAGTADGASVKRFCSQCGAGIQPADRFCASCGVQLA